jgi:urea carboxylase
MVFQREDPWTMFHLEVGFQLSMRRYSVAKLTSTVANILVDNDPGTETFEITLSGPELLFTTPAVFAVSGAPVPVTIDGEEKPMWSRVNIQAGQKLKIGKVENGGCRCYLAVKGGFPEMSVFPTRFIL